MGKRRYPSDPKHPDFPHGTITGRDKGCGCDDCREARARSERHRTYRRATGKLGPKDFVDGEPAIAKLREWSTRYSHRQIGRFTGVSACRITTILKHDRPGRRMHARTAHKILTAQEPGTADLWVPGARYRQRLYSLLAAEYPMTWIAAQLGYRGNSTFSSAARQNVVQAETFNRLDLLYRKIGDTPASRYPGHIFTVHQRRIAKTTAQRHGYFPPIHYDDDGALIPGSVRNEKIETRKAERDRMARERLEVLRLSLAGMNPAEIGSRTGTHIDLTAKIRSEARLRFSTTPGRAGSGQRNVSVIRPESEPRAAEVRAILEAHFDDHESDPFETVRALGLMQAKKYDFDRPAKGAQGEPAQDAATAAESTVAA